MKLVVYKKSPPKLGGLFGFISVGKVIF